MSARSDDDLLQLAEHAAWADAAAWTAVLVHPDGAADERIASWLHHLHTVQHAFLRLWRGVELLFPELAEFRDRHELAVWGREAHAGIREHLADADPPTLDRELVIPWSARIEERLGRPAAPITIRQSVIQVAMHTAHHRGQVLARLRALGGEPSTIDFLYWLWLGRPPAAWPEREAERGG